jgi:esterase/lipase superfamily enzyme
MRVRSLVLALLLATGLASAADKPKPVKVKKHAVTTPKTAKRTKEATKGEVHKAPKVAKHKVSTPKVVKHKTTNVKRHKA